MKTKTDTTHFGQNDYEIVNREVLYQGMFRLARYHLRHRLFNNGWSDVFTREVFERHSAAAVLPYDPILDRVILIEQFRPGSIANPEGPWLLEIPAGILEEDNQPGTVAHHEAEEEAGCTVAELIPISEFFVSPGAQNEYIHIFCGRTDASNVSGIHGLKQEHENIRVHNLSTDEAIATLQAGKIKTCPAIVALLWLQLNREKLKNLWK